MVLFSLLEVIVEIFLERFGVVHAPWVPVAIFRTPSRCAAQTRVSLGQAEFLIRIEDGSSRASLVVGDIAHANVMRSRTLAWNGEEAIRLRASKSASGIFWRDANE